MNDAKFRSAVRARMKETGETYGEAFAKMAENALAHENLDGVGRITTRIQGKVPQIKSIGCSLCRCTEFKRSNETEDERCECAHGEEDHG